MDTRDRDTELILCTCGCSVSLELLVHLHGLSVNFDSLDARRRLLLSSDLGFTPESLSFFPYLCFGTLYLYYILTNSDDTHLLIFHLIRFRMTLP